MRFVVDRHLGRLAKWLRTLGYEAFFEVDCQDEILRHQAAREDSVFVTSAEEIAVRIGASRFVIVPKGNIKLQLPTVVRQLAIDPYSNLFSRCVICDVPVVVVSKEECKEKIPEKVYKRFDDYRRCPRCERIYWMGTHTERLRRNLDLLLGADR